MQINPGRDSLSLLHGGRLGLPHFPAAQLHHALALGMRGKDEFSYNKLLRVPLKTSHWTGRSNRGRNEYSLLYQHL